MCEIQFRSSFKCLAFYFTWIIIQKNIGWAIYIIYFHHRIALSLTKIWSEKSLIYIENNYGPRMGSWENPGFTCVHEEIWLFNITLCVRSVKKPFTILVRPAEILHCFNLKIKSHNLSKACEISRETPFLEFSLKFEVNILDGKMEEYKVFFCCLKMFLEWTSWTGFNINIVLDRRG